jgi:hypothetical protein
VWSGPPCRTTPTISATSSRMSDSTTADGLTSVNSVTSRRTLSRKASRARCARNRTWRFTFRRCRRSTRRCSGFDGVRHQEALDKATKVLVFLMQSIGIEPCCAQPHQMRTQRDVFGSNQIDEAPNRCERVTRSNSDENVIAFTGVQSRFCTLNECPGQVGCLHVRHCDHRPLGASLGR